MQQCTNCKCQVGSGIAVCPYCGAWMPPEEPASVPFPQKPIGPRDYSGNERTQWVETRSIVARPAPEKHEVPMETVLLMLLACMIVANIFEFVALLLVLC